MTSLLNENKWWHSFWWRRPPCLTTELSVSSPVQNDHAGLLWEELTYSRWSPGVGKGTGSKLGKGTGSKFATLYYRDTEPSPVQRQSLWKKLHLRRGSCGQGGAHGGRQGYSKSTLLQPLTDSGAGQDLLHEGIPQGSGLTVHILFSHYM